MHATYPIINSTIAILPAIIMIFTLSCADNNDTLDYLNGKEQSFSCDHSQQVISIEFEASDNWTTAIEYAINPDDSWISIEPRNGIAGKYNLKITIAGNQETDMRKATIYIQSHNETLKYDITQSADDNTEEPSGPNDPTVPDNPFDPETPNDEIDSRKFIKSIEISLTDKYGYLISDKSVTFSYDDNWKIKSVSSSGGDNISLQYGNDLITLHDSDNSVSKYELSNGKLCSIGSYELSYESSRLKTIYGIPIIWNDGNAFTAVHSDKVSEIHYSDFQQTGNIHLSMLCILSIIDNENYIPLIPLLQYGLLGERSINAIGKITISGDKYLFNYLLDSSGRIIGIDEFTIISEDENYMSRRYKIAYMP